LKWTGVSKALLLPPKKAVEGIKMTYTPTEAETGSTGSLPWNQGFSCQGPDLASPSPANVLRDITNKKYYKNKKMRAKECMQYCEDNNYNISQLPAADRKGLHMTCCEWVPATTSCNFVLGGFLEYSGTSSSAVFAPGSKLIEKDTLALNC